MHSPITRLTENSNLIKLTGHPDSFGGPKNIQICVRRSLPMHASEQVNVIGLVSIIYIRECGSTLYVGMAHTAPPMQTSG